MIRINYPSNPDLRYRYPDPTPEILNNMMHAIATVPRLYVQTLHLMNKMNLPPPFGPIQNESIPTLLVSYALLKPIIFLFKTSKNYSKAY